MDAPGWGADLAPLTDLGEYQVIQQLPKIQDFNPELVISSPATRALHSALVIRPALQAPFKVEFDLHEWVPDQSFHWKHLRMSKRFRQIIIVLTANGRWGKPGHGKHCRVCERGHYLFFANTLTISGCW